MVNEERKGKKLFGNNSTQTYALSSLLYIIHMYYIAASVELYMYNTLDPT